MSRNKSTTRDMINDITTIIASFVFDFRIKLKCKSVADWTISFWISVSFGVRIPSNAWLTKLFNASSNIYNENVHFLYVDNTKLCAHVIFIKIDYQLFIQIGSRFWNETDSGIYIFTTGGQMMTKLVSMIHIYMDCRLNGDYILSFDLQIAHEKNKILIFLINQLIWILLLLHTN